MSSLIAFDSDVVKFGFNFFFYLVFGKSSVDEINLSRAAFLSEGSTKLLLFLTSELSVSSVPSKCSTSRNFLLNN